MRKARIRYIWIVCAVKQRRRLMTHLLICYLFSASTESKRSEFEICRFNVSRSLYDEQYEPQELNQQLKLHATVRQKKPKCDTSEWEMSLLWKEFRIQRWVGDVSLLKSEIYRILSLQLTIDMSNGARRKLWSSPVPILHPCRRQRREWKHESITRRRTWGEWRLITVYEQGWCIHQSEFWKLQKSMSKQ